MITIHNRLHTIKMKLQFRHLGQLVKYRNSFLPGMERSDSKIRLARHRLANNNDMTLNTSSEDFNDLGVNSRWNADTFSSWRIQRAIHQYPQSSTS